MRGAARSSSAIGPPPIPPRKRGGAPSLPEAALPEAGLPEAGRGRPGGPGRSGEGVLDHRLIFFAERFGGGLLAGARIRLGDIPLADRVERQIARLPDHRQRSQKALLARFLGLADGKVLGKSEERLFHFFRIGGGDELRLGAVVRHRLPLTSEQKIDDHYGGHAPLLSRQRRPAAACRQSRGCHLALGLVSIAQLARYYRAMLLASVLDRFIGIGRLSVIDAAGERHVFEGSPGPSATIRLHDPRLHWKLLLRPRLFVPEAYMDGKLTVEEGSLYDFIEILVSNDAAQATALPLRLGQAAGRLVRRLHQYNPVPRAHRNVAHHYDLSDQLYELFLDRDRQYSCAYFRTPADDLDTAQESKKRHIAAKLLLRPGQTVLDVGSGWGGLALYLAAECGADVTGLTLSVEQHKAAMRRVAAAGLSERVRFYLRDYREELGRYDRIVSVGMFEHVGINHYSAFFAKLKSLMTPDGIALLHSIGRKDGPGSTHPWIRKYIFPGGYAPALSEVLPTVERSKLWITDIEILRLHYAETLRAWRGRFERNRDRLRRIYDERFCRMWEMYLICSEIAFRRQDHMVFQMQLSKAVDAVPLTRDYLLGWEREQSADSDRAA